MPTPEAIARAFHEVYEDIAPEFGYATRPESKVSWDDLSENHKALMIATVRAVVIERFNLLRIAEAAEITHATIQGNDTFTIAQLRTWDGPVLLREALAAVKGGSNQ